VQEQHAKRLTTAGRVVTAAGWIAAIALVLDVVVWHDRTFWAYWDEKFQSGTLFLSQRGFLYHREPAPEPAQSYPRWIAIMRWEANLWVGLAAASDGVVVVNEIRQRRGWRKPGAVACFVAMATRSLCATQQTSQAIKYGTGLYRHPIFNPFPNSWPLSEVQISLAVPRAWVVMAATGRWRPQRTWADRVGGLVGGLWLVVTLYRLAASLFIPFGNWYHRCAPNRPGIVLSSQ
jgi:hypothetical protein